jgi:hypothetical protein
MAQQIQAMEKLRELPKINYSDPVEVEARIKQFFKFCEEVEMRPTVELMALAIGVSRKTLWAWEQEGNTRGEIISRAKQCLAALMEQWGITGRVNPAAMCFLMKNHFGYHDDIRIEPVQTNKLDSLPTKEEIVRKLPGKSTDDENDVDLSELLEE